MTESHRQDPTTYCAALPKDLTGMIDQMAHPLSTRPLQFLDVIDLAMTGLSRGVNYIETRKDDTSDENILSYYSPDQSLLMTYRMPQKVKLIDLRGAEDNWSVFCDETFLHIKRQSYQFRRGSGDEVLCFQVEDEPHMPRGPDITFSSDTLMRGAEGWIYFLSDRHRADVYRLNVSCPTVVQRLPVMFQGRPLIPQALKATLKTNQLILYAGETCYRWNLDTQEVTRLPFDVPSADTYLDPLTGTMYYSLPLHRQPIQIYREDQTLILVAPLPTEDSSGPRVHLTLTGQLIIQFLQSDDTWITHLYG